MLGAEDVAGAAASIAAATAGSSKEAGSEEAESEGGGETKMAKVDKEERAGMRTPSPSALGALDADGDEDGKLCNVNTCTHTFTHARTQARTY